MSGAFLIELSILLTTLRNITVSPGVTTFPRDEEAPWFLVLVWITTIVLILGKHFSSPGSESPLLTFNVIFILGYFAFIKKSILCLQTFSRRDLLFGSFEKTSNNIYNGIIFPSLNHAKLTPFVGP